MHNLLQSQMLWTVAGGVLAVLVVAILLSWRFRPHRLKISYFQPRWQEIQRQCGKAETWPLAVINADKLLDQALKQLRIKGKTMGERLVTAQRRLSDNDGVWFGHKLRNRIVHEEVPRLYRKDVEAALRGFRQALKDLGGLK